MQSFPGTSQVCHIVVCGEVEVVVFEVHPISHSGAGGVGLLEVVDVVEVVEFEVPPLCGSTTTLEVVF
ncbi:unnamed protein product [Boreogadus saida]